MDIYIYIYIYNVLYEMYDGSNKISLLPPFLCQYFQNDSDIDVGKTTSPDLCICVVYTPMLTRGEKCRNRWYVIYGGPIFNIITVIVCGVFRWTFGPWH